MSADETAQDFAELMQQGWIANYPPWFYCFWIKPAKCKTKEETTRLLQLLRAIEDGKPEEMRRLLPGFDPNLRLGVEGKKTESLLEWAVEKTREPECIRLLIAAGAHLKSPHLLWKAVFSSQTEILSEALKAGADPNSVPEAEIPLLAAVDGGDSKAVRLLLDAGARPDVTTTFYITNHKRVNKVTALMLAAHSGSVDIVKLLLAAGADVRAKDSAGNTAIAWAKISRAKSKAAKIIPLLERAGATAGAANLPEPVDFEVRAKTPTYRSAIRLARTITESRPRTVELPDRRLVGANAFRIRNSKAAAAILEEIRPKLTALGALAFLTDRWYERSVPYLILVPTADFREAIIAFETPVGQSMDCYDLIAWLDELGKTQPFVMTHLDPDLFRARFTSPIKNAKRLAKAIEKICPDVINAPLDKVAKELDKTRELFLWWD